MQCLKSKKIEKQENQILDKIILTLYLDAIDNLKIAENLSEIKNLKKMKGFNNAYRIKIKTYRLCFYLTDNIIYLEKIEHRKTSYKNFP